MDNEEHCVIWKDYKDHMTEVYFNLFETESMVDVTLCAEGQYIYAHRIVLSACSSYLKAILSSSEESHPFIILSEMKFEDVKSIIEFVYRGEISLPADRFMTMLKTAEDLHINGLMEVVHYLPDVGIEDGNEVTLEVWDAIEESSELAVCQNVSIYIDPNDASFGSSINSASGQEPSEVLVVTTDVNRPTRAKKRKRESSKKEYTEEALAAALEDLKSGKSMVEASIAHHIPRSTLYVRARNQNISVAPCRQDHPYEKIQAALKAVSDGASLQQASDLFKIPKTVLWRRVHKDAHNSSVKQVKRREACAFERKNAAIMALERGEKISKVSMQYQIPRTTLFREKTRLVESGKLPWTSQKKRLTNSDECKEIRLHEAVAACREGKMSQATASQKFQVPKTTIWRRLKDSRLQENSNADVDKKASSVEHLPLVDNDIDDPDSVVTGESEQESLSNNVHELVPENIVDSSSSQSNPVENCSNPQNNSQLDTVHGECSTVSHLCNQPVFSLEEVPKTTIWRRLKDSRLQDSSTADVDKKASSVENLPLVDNDIDDPESVVTGESEQVSLSSNVDGLVSENIVESSSSQSNSVENCSNPQNNSQLDTFREECSPVSHLRNQSVFSLEEVSTHMPVTYIDEANFADSSLIILSTTDETGIELQGNTQLIIEPNSNSQCVAVSKSQENASCSDKNESQFVEK